MHTGNPLRTRLPWLLVTLLALPLLVGQGVAAQDATPAGAPAVAPDQYVDMSAFCAGIGTPTPGPSAIPGAALELIPIVVENEDKSVLAGEWELPVGAYLTLKGEAALLAVDEGLVTVVSCGAPLQFGTEPATEPDDPTLTELPADMGLAVDPSFANGIFLLYAGHAGTVAIVAQDEVDSRIYLEVAGTAETDGVCTATDCWDWTDVTPSDEEAGFGTPAAGPPRPGICGWYRC